MNFTVAVETGTTRSLVVRIHSTCESTLEAGCIAANRVFARVLPVMTRLAQPRRTGRQQRRNVGTVRHVAVRAVLHRRLVFEQVRAALVCMASPTGLVDCVLLDQTRAGGSMGIVAVGADDLAFLDRVG